VTAKIGLFLILLNKKALCLCPHFPIHMAKFIPRIIGPVFCKLYTKAIVGRTMQTTNESLHNMSGFEFQWSKAAD
jgi:hypothetical protein